MEAVRKRKPSLTISDLRPSLPPILHQPLLWAMSLTAVTLTFVIFAGGQSPAADAKRVQIPVDLALLDDATLRAIHFVDPDRGWAVGDLGVILHTRDGGTNWLYQTSGVQCRLLDIDFSSDDVGMIVGGWYENDTGLSRALILRTTDGGTTWNQVANDLPMLHRVQMLADGGVIVAGDWSTVYQGRIAYSQSQGADWISIDGQTISEFSSYDLASDSISVVDAQGVLHRTSDFYQPPKAVSVPGAVSLIRSRKQHYLATLLDDKSPILFASRDGGRHWNQFGLIKNGNSKSTVDNAFFPNTMFLADNGTAWIAGTPGNRIVKIDDQNVLQNFDTRQHAPLYDICFLDPFRGWAVGAFGTILATRDGGETWRPQRETERRSLGQQRRVMVLGVARESSTLPWPVLAAESLDSGMRVASAIGTDPRLNNDSIAGETAPYIDANPLLGDRLERCRDAATRVGGGEVLCWSESENAKDGTAVQNYTIDAIIRAYQPAVVVLSDDLNESDKQTWLAACIRHGVQRVFQTSTTRPDVTISSAAILPNAAAITGDLWRTAIEIVHPHSAIPEGTSLRLSWNHTTSDVRGSSVTAGISAPGSVRIFQDSRRRNLQVLQARSATGTLLDRLIQRATVLDAMALKSEIESLVNQTPQEHQQQLLRDIIVRCRRRSDSTALVVFLTALNVAIERFSDSGLERWAALTKRSMLTSAEWQPVLQSLRLESDLTYADYGGGAPDSSLRTISPPTGAYESPFERRAPIAPSPVSAVTPADTNQNESDDRFANFGIQLMSAFENPLPANGNPLVAYANSIETATIETEATERSSSTVETLNVGELELPWRLHPIVLAWQSKYGDRSLDPLQLASVQQLSESNSAGVWNHYFSPRHIITAKKLQVKTGSSGSQRPVLDGLLSDDCWLPKFNTNTHLPETETAQSLMVNPHRLNVDCKVAYDDEYIYFALSGIFTDQDQAVKLERRVRDDDLKKESRMLLELDVDRDLLTKFELRVDRMGRTRDTCDGFTVWDPTWYVASSVNRGIRTVELALRRSDVTSLPIVPGADWHIRARILPADNDLVFGSTVSDSSNFLIADPRNWKVVRFE